jgi:hypothetical protein
VVSCHLRAIGGYLVTGSRLAIFAIVEKNHVMMSMEVRQSLGCRMPLVIPSKPLKDRIIVGLGHFEHSLSLI